MASTVSYQWEAEKKLLQSKVDEQAAVIENYEAEVTGLKGEAEELRRELEAFKQEQNIIEEDQLLNRAHRRVSLAASVAGSEYFSCSDFSDSDTEVSEKEPEKRQRTSRQSFTIRDEKHLECNDLEIIRIWELFEGTRWKEIIAKIEEKKGKLNQPEQESNPVAQKTAVLRFPAMEFKLKKLLSNRTYKDMPFAMLKTKQKSVDGAYGAASSSGSTGNHQAACANCGKILRARELWGLHYECKLHIDKCTCYLVEMFRNHKLRGGIVVEERGNSQPSSHTSAAGSSQPITGFRRLGKNGPGLPKPPNKQPRSK